MQRFFAFLILEKIHKRALVVVVACQLVKVLAAEHPWSLSFHPQANEVVVDLVKRPKASQQGIVDVLNILIADTIDAEVVPECLTYQFIE